MRILRLAIISILIFFLLFTVISFFFPSHIRISKAINLKGDKDSIFILIADTKNWTHWHPAFRQEDVPQALLQKGLVGKPLTQTDTLIAVQLIKNGNRSVVNGWQLHSFPSTDSLTLQWYMDFHLSWYPWHKFSSLFYEKTYGTMMEQGLTNIKERAQQ